MAEFKISTRPMKNFHAYKEWHIHQGVTGSLEYGYMIDNLRSTGPTLHLVWKLAGDGGRFFHLRETTGTGGVWLSGCSLETVLASEQKLIGELPQSLGAIIQRELVPYKMDLV